MAITAFELIAEAEKHDRAAAVLRQAAEILLGNTAVGAPAQPIPLQVIPVTKKPGRAEPKAPAAPSSSADKSVKKSTEQLSDRPTCCVCLKKLHRDGTACADCNRRACSRHLSLKRGEKRCSECIAKMPDKVAAPRKAAPKPKEATDEVVGCESCKKFAASAKCASCGKNICGFCSRRMKGQCEECHAVGD